MLGRSFGRCHKRATIRSGQHHKHWALPLCALALACGATERSAPEQQDPSLGQPFSACTTSSNTSVPFQRVADSADAPLLRWRDAASCIQVGVAPELDAALPALDIAVAAYNSIDCSTLCFEAPTTLPPGPGTSLVRGLEVAGSGEPIAIQVSDELDYDETTGELLRARLLVDLAQAADVSPEAFMHHLGHVVGLAHTTDVDSVMQPVSAGRTSLSSYDEAAVCAMYGSTPTLCSDG